MHALSIFLIALPVAALAWGLLSAFLFVFEYWSTRTDDEALVGAGFAILGIAYVILGIVGIVGAVEHTDCHDLPNSNPEITAVRFDMDEGCFVRLDSGWDGWSDDADRRQELSEEQWIEIKEAQGV